MEEPEDRRGRVSACQEKAERLSDLFRIWLAKPRAKHPENAALMRGRFLDRRGVSELAAAMGLTVLAVRSRIERLKKQFRAWAMRRLNEEARRSGESF